MKTLFLAALIIACVSASTVQQVPSVLLGNWNYDASLPNSQNTCGGCTYQSVNFAQNSDSTITLSVTGNCSASYTLQNVVASGTLSTTTVTIYSLTDQNNDDWSVGIYNLTAMSIGSGLELELITPSTPVLDFCTLTFSNSATIMKAMVGAVIAAAVMLI